MADRAFCPVLCFFCITTCVAPVKVLGEDGNGKVFEESAVTYLPFLQLPLGLFAFSDVLCGAMQPGDATVRIAFYLTAGSDPFAGSIKPCLFQIKLVRLPCLHCYLDRGIQACRTFRRVNF